MCPRGTVPISDMLLVLLGCEAGRRNTGRNSRPTMTASDVTGVVVCTGSLCMSQNSGDGALELLAELRSRDLAFPVDESSCLSACGRCAMVAIDYADGTSSLVGGLDRMLLELGLEASTNAPSLLQ